MTRSSRELLERFARVAVVPVVLLGLAYATVVQSPGPNERAHFALVRSFAHGTTAIDEYRTEHGDVSWYRGHYYAAKAPGLALVTTPAYIALTRLHILDLIPRRLEPAKSETPTIWALGLVGVVIPAAVLLLLIRHVAERHEPGLGTLTAVTAGLCTLLLPFSTLFFDHVLAATLGFAAFVVIWSRSHRGRALLGAGVLAGFAVTTDYPLALIALALGVYALSRTRHLIRTAPYVGGFAIGAAPLFVYNRLAFGSLTHFPYKDAVSVSGRTGHDVLGANAQGLFGVGVPSFRSAMELLFSPIGLLTLTPVVALGWLGIVFLYRRNRSEALLFGSIVVAYLVYNSGYSAGDRPLFGGWTPGPRFLIATLPFVAVGFAPAYRRLPALTGSMAAGSCVTMIAVTISNPKLAWDGRWASRIANGSFGRFGVVPFLPFLLLVAAVLVLTYRKYGLARPRGNDLIAAVTLLPGWIVLALLAHRFLDHTAGSAVAVLAFACTVVLAATAAYRYCYRLAPDHLGRGGRDSDASDPILLSNPTRLRESQSTHRPDRAARPRV